MAIDAFGGGSGSPRSAALSSGPMSARSLLDEHPASANVIAKMQVANNLDAMIRVDRRGAAQPGLLFTFIRFERLSRPVRTMSSRAGTNFLIASNLRAAEDGAQPTCALFVRSRFLASFPN